ncbi:MAG: alpha-amylase [Bacteroidaceae bacterium]|nr:alpha-amylase [Bacteroidaceae bacterium]
MKQLLCTLSLALRRVGAGLFLPVFLSMVAVGARAQGWPADYDGVMLQGFYWDGYADTQWTNLEAQADELAESFSLVWVPQSGWCGSTTNMGYTPQYYWNQRSAFGSEAELRSLIAALKQRGTGLVADVVINHRESVGGWFTYPKETYKGETYQMFSTDICANDDGGAARDEAARQGVSLSSNNDTGEDWSGCRDLDHKSANVQRVVKAYLHYLLEDLGYTGFRYDMVKGYSPEFTALYNQDARPAFSVGECWDSNDNIKQWINGTKTNGVPNSAAFDFQFRYNVRDAINDQDWSRLKSDNRLIAYNDYKRYAVTFVENHDMEYRSASAQQDPIRRDTLQANAFLLAMPGTPCVFLTHWKAYKQELKSMIEARRLAGVTNTSTYTTQNATSNYYAASVQGQRGRLYVVVGKPASIASRLPFVASTYVEILLGHGYRYLLSKDTEVAWLDLASGKYDTAIDVRCIAVSNQRDAQLVYTLDGSTPTAQSATIESGQSLHLEQSCTVTLGLLVGGEVKHTVRHHYDVTPFIPRQATVYCRPMATLVSQWPTMNYYLWTRGGTQVNGNWPGKRIAETVEIGGQTWFVQTVAINSPRETLNAVFSTGDGNPQSVDVSDIDETAFFVIKPTQSEGKYEVTDVTSAYIGYTAIEAPASASPTRGPLYDLQGRRVQHPRSGHLYIRDGRKVRW